MQIFGNTRTVTALVEEFPAVALLTGPTSVGKWTAAEHARQVHKIREPDVIRVRRLWRSEAREVVDFASRFSSTEHGKAAIIDLDAGEPAAVDVLLKVTEEPADGMHFLLVTSKPVPVTLLSRARVFEFGLLTQAEVSALLQDQRKMSPSLADRLAEQSGGRVSTALSALTHQDDKALVLAAVRALREHDAVGLESLADRWREEHTDLLVQWATEAVSRRWMMFNEAETGTVGPIPLRTLMVLRTYARPRLVVRSSLMSVLRSTRAG